ncbi:MAG: hypothetical protein JWN93_1898 [Hyphomicrobiales bacterium]|jgi:hypothetical protein|nr:hypothetical protein [Hyphomicrobiales bacterium]
MRVRLPHLALAALLALGLSACASARSQPDAGVDLTPPPKRQLDAKTQLETGRRY